MNKKEIFEIKMKRLKEINTELERMIERHQNQKGMTKTQEEQAETEKDALS